MSTTKNRVSGTGTNQSLLRRVRNRADSKSWREFFGLYHPILLRYAMLRGLSRDDAEDVAQECMRILSTQMATFDYSRSRGRFKGFVCTLANNTISNMFRRRRPRRARTAELAQIPVADQSDREAWDRTWLQGHLRCCLRLLEPRFAPSTIAAFKMYVLRGRPVDEVCRDLGLSAEQVYQAKSRVTGRLRAEMGKLIGKVL